MKPCTWTHILVVYAAWLGGCGAPPQSTDQDGGALDLAPLTCVVGAQACVFDAECDDGSAANGHEICDPCSAEADDMGCVNGVTIDPPPADDGLPHRPDVVDTGADTGELFFRLGDFQLNSNVHWYSIGRNLDRLDTQAASPMVQCRAPAPASPLPLDGLGGSDNAFGATLVDMIDFAIPCFEEELAQAHRRGQSTLILRITEWNGTLNDSRVGIALLVSADGTSADAATVMWDSAARELVNVSDSLAAAPATGAAADTYFVRNDSLTNGTPPVARVSDSEGYINGGTFVFRLPDREEIPLDAGIGSLGLSLTDAVIVGRLTASFDGFDRGVLSGRLSLADLLNAGEGIGLCAGGAQAIVEMAFQELLDVRSNASDPNDPESECDAVSVGLPFTGTSVTVATNPDGSLLTGTNDPVLPNACAFMDANPGAPLCPLPPSGWDRATHLRGGSVATM